MFLPSRVSTRKAQFRKMTRQIVAGAIIGCSLGSSAAFAQDASSLKLQFNRAQDTDKGCLVTFVASNNSDVSFDAIAYEFVLFNSDGLVEQMTAFDFGAMPVKKTVVRQFQLAGLKCASIGQILLNGAARCKVADDTAPEGVKPSNLCIEALETETRTSIAFIK